MSFIEDLAEYIEDETSYTVGKDIYIGSQPSRVDKKNAIVVYETGGQEPVGYFNHYKPGVQAYIRASDYNTAESMAKTVFDALHRTENAELQTDGWYAYYILAVSNPQHIGQDDNGNHEFSINFNTQVR